MMDVTRHIRLTTTLLRIPLWVEKGRIVITHNMILLSLTHCDRMTHICVGKLTIIGSENGLSPRRRQANIWTNAGSFLIESLEQTSMKYQSEFKYFHWRKCAENVVCEMTSILSRPRCVNRALFFISCNPFIDTNRHIFPTLHPPETKGKSLAT